MTHTSIEQVETWLDNVVIGLNLCPFAAKPRRLQQVHFDLFQGTKDMDLLEHLHRALIALEEKKPDERETSIIIIENHLKDFDDYNQFLDYADGLLEQEGWLGQFQVASFHPAYQFADTQADDSENLTNRAPFPLLHLIREEQLEMAVEKYSQPELIPENNIKRMAELTDTEKKVLFPYLFN